MAKNNCFMTTYDLLLLRPSKAAQKAEISFPWPLH